MDSQRLGEIIRRLVEAPQKKMSKASASPGAKRVRIETDRRIAIEDRDVVIPFVGVGDAAIMSYDLVFLCEFAAVKCSRVELNRLIEITLYLSFMPSLQVVKAVRPHGPGDHEDSHNC